MFFQNYFMLLQNYFIDRFDLIRTPKVRLNAVLDIGIITKIGIKTKLLILQRAILTSLNPFYSMKPHLTSFNKIWRMLAYLTTANQKVVRTGLFLYFWFSDVFRGKERDQGFLKILLTRQSWVSSGACLTKLNQTTSVNIFFSFISRSTWKQINMIHQFWGYCKLGII